MPGERVEGGRLHGTDLAIVVGRSDEQAVVAEMLARAAGSRGGTLVLEGEAGVGKSALLADLAVRARARGFAVLADKAVELEARTPFAALRRCLGLDHPGDDGLADLAALLRGTASPAWGESGDAMAQLEFRVSEATVAYVEERANREPLVLIADDIQWADASTLRTLLRVAAVVEPLPVVIAGAARRELRSPEADTFVRAAADQGAVVLTVTALDDDTIPTLVQAWVGARPGPKLLDRLSAAAGNPFFLGVLVDALQEAGELTFAEGRVDVERTGPVPPLPLSILQKLRFCSASTLDVLTFAAVLGPSFTATDLASVRGESITELLPALREGLATGILREAGDTLAFRHDLIREALYLDLPATVRNELHLSIARRFAATAAHPTLVAEHLLRGATHGGPEVVDLLHRTGVDSVSVAPTVAVDLLQRAADLADHPGARDRVLPDLAVALLRASRSAEGAAAGAEALAKGLRPTAARNLRLCIVQSLSERGRLTETLEEIGRGLDDPDTTPEDRAQFEAIGGVMRLLLGDVGGAADAAERGLAAAEVSGARVAKIRALETLALTERLAGRMSEALDAAARAVQIADEERSFDGYHPLPHLVHGMLLVDVGRLDAALATDRRGLEAIELFGTSQAASLHHVCIARDHFVLGAWDEADTEAEIAMGLVDENSLQFVPDAHIVCALIALHRNELETTKLWFQRLDDGIARSGSQFRPGPTAAARAELMEAEGRQGAALEHLRAAWQFCVDVGLRSELPALGPPFVRLAVAAGETARLGEVVDEMAALAGGNPGATALEGAASYCRGLVERDVGSLVDAVNAFRAGGAILDRLAAIEGAAAALAGEGRRADATALYDEALANYGELHASRDIARVTAALRALGVTSGARGPRRRPKTGWEALTDTELSVVRLVTERLSNPEIAERLFISRRTVQTHVSHALAKIGVSSRGELAAAAARHHGWSLTLGGAAP